MAAWLRPHPRRSVQRSIRPDSHAVLHGDTATERRDPVDRLLRDRLGVIEEPMEPVKRDVLVHALEDVEGAADRLVVGGVQPPRPAVLGEDARHRLELRLHLRRHVGARLAEVFEVGSREHQHLACPVVTEIVIALLILRRSGPAQEVLLFTLGLLSEQVVSEADRELTVGRQLLDHGVVFGIVLEAATGVDRASDAQPIELAHEVARRVRLIVERQLRTLGERRVEDARVRLGEQQPGRRAIRAAHDLTARRVRRVPVYPTARNAAALRIARS